VRPTKFGCPLRMSEVQVGRAPCDTMRYNPLRNENATASYVLHQRNCILFTKQSPFTRFAVRGKAQPRLSSERWVRYSSLRKATRYSRKPNLRGGVTHVVLPSASPYLLEIIMKGCFRDGVPTTTRACEHCSGAT
jgi:hypothetical protein